jgi:hypothetical protein
VGAGRLPRGVADAETAAARTVGKAAVEAGLGGEANTRGRGTEATAARAAAPRCYGSAPGFSPFRAF